jgi:hypothetical protein
MSEHLASEELKLPELTDEQRRAVAADYLAKLAASKPDLVPKDIYLPMLSLVPATTVEVSLVKPSTADERRALIVLTQRPETDTFWANQWHIPGSIVRGNDPIKHEHDFDAAITRAMDEVNGGLKVVYDPVAYDLVRRRGPRGSETTARFMVETVGEPMEGAFFDAQYVIENPPEGGLIDTHAEAIEKLASTYYDLRSKK